MPKSILPRTLSSSRSKPPAVDGPYRRLLESDWTLRKTSLPLLEPDVQHCNFGSCLKRCASSNKCVNSMCRRHCLFSQEWLGYKSCSLRGHHISLPFLQPSSEPSPSHSPRSPSSPALQPSRLSSEPGLSSASELANLTLDGPASISSTDVYNPPHNFYTLSDPTDTDDPDAPRILGHVTEPGPHADLWYHNLPEELHGNLVFDEEGRLIPCTLYFESPEQHQ